MPAPSLILDDNIRYLRQGLALIESISDPAYTRNHPPLYRSGIGPHFRHCLDHFSSFFEGTLTGRIDYDARERDLRIETDRAHAAALIRELIQRLGKFDPTRLDEVVWSKTDCGGEEEDPWSQSTHKRELQFLVSHTVHHYALIALIARHQGVEPPPTFGVAPSTLRHEEAMSTCAR